MDVVGVGGAGLSPSTSGGTNLAGSHSDFIRNPEPDSGVRSRVVFGNAKFIGGAETAAAGTARASILVVTNSFSRAAFLAFTNLTSVMA